MCPLPALHRLATAAVRPGSMGSAPSSAFSARVREAGHPGGSGRRDRPSRVAVRRWVDSRRAAGKPTLPTLAGGLVAAAGGGHRIV